MLLKIFYVLFVFFTQQQIYASNNFMGSSESVGCALNLFSGVNGLLSTAALIHIAFSVSLVEALIMFGVTFVAVIVLNLINIPAIFSALIGIPFNIFYIIYYIINFKSWEAFL